MLRMNESDSQSLEHLRTVLKTFDTAMLVTHAPEGRLRGRPMALAGVDEDGKLWFFTQNDTGKTHEIENDAEVNIVCQRDGDAYASISGRATISHDQAKINELWKESFKVWFSLGKVDPSLALISILPEDGEYWENGGLKRVKYLLDAVRAYATGVRPRLPEPEQHGKIHLHG